MKPVPHGEPYAGKLHVRFDEGAGVPYGASRSTLHPFDSKAKLSRLEELSRLVIFRTTPDTRRSKRPTKATLGLGKRPKSP